MIYNIFVTTYDNNIDCVGQEINAGDTIVYFTRRGSDIYSQRAVVEFIGTANSRSPHIKVVREDAETKNKFTRKAWLWSFRNAVKINTTENKL